MNLHVPVSVEIPPPMPAPNRPGHYYLRLPNKEDVVGVATVVHKPGAVVEVCVTSPNNTVQTENFLVPCARQDEAWSLALFTYARVLRVDVRDFEIHDHPQDPAKRRKHVSRSLADMMGYGSSVDAVSPMSGPVDLDNAPRTKLGM